MLHRLSEVVDVVQSRGDVHVRYSDDIENDIGSRSVDGESGLALPGLSVNPLAPESWWTRPLEDWVARQLCQYAHLTDEDPEAKGYLLTGATIGRGPDREPLLQSVSVVDEIANQVLEEAERLYNERFDRQ
jgi:hypothetical protein